MLNLMIWMLVILLSLWILAISPLMGWVDRKLANNERTAAFFGYTEEDVAELNAKKAPTAATAGAQNLTNNIYPLSVAQTKFNRKAAK